MAPSYAEACKEYNLKIEKNDSEKVNVEISQLLSKINAKLPDNNPDRDQNEIEFISKYLYKKNELTSYYKMAQEYNFDLKGIIYDWVKKLILLIHHMK
jgi:hypothetical protein